MDLTMPERWQQVAKELLGFASEHAVAGDLQKALNWARAAADMLEAEAARSK